MARGWRMNRGAEAIVQDYAARKRKVTSGMRQASYLSGSSIHEVGYGAGFEVELMIGHEAVLWILPRAYIFCI